MAKAKGAENFSGVWQSSYRYFSTARGREFCSKHLVRFHKIGNQLVIESIPGANRAYLIVRLSLDNNIATGSWQEETNPNGSYKGAIYYGALQFVISDDRKYFKGRWVGFNRKTEVDGGSWEFTYLGEDLPGTVARSDKID